MDADTTKEYIVTQDSRECLDILTDAFFIAHEDAEAIRDVADKLSDILAQAQGFREADLRDIRRDLKESHAMARVLCKALTCLIADLRKHGDALHQVTRDITLNEIEANEL